MPNVGRKLAFVLASTTHGTMIVNRFDYRMFGPGRGIGLGFKILETAAFDRVEVEMAVQAAISALGFRPQLIRFFEHLADPKMS